MNLRETRICLPGFAARWPFVRPPIEDKHSTVRAQRINNNIVKLINTELSFGIDRGGAGVFARVLDENYNVENEKPSSRYQFDSILSTLGTVE